MPEKWDQILNPPPWKRKKETFGHSAFSYLDVLCALSSSPDYIWETSPYHCHHEMYTVYIYSCKSWCPGGFRPAKAASGREEVFFCFFSKELIIDSLLLFTPLSPDAVTPPPCSPSSCRPVQALIWYENRWSSQRCCCCCCCCRWRQSRAV